MATKWSNTKRRDNIRRILQDDFGLKKRGQKSYINDAPEAVTDLLADLLHYCDGEGLDFALLERRAYGHYQTELFEGRKK